MTTFDRAFRTVKPTPTEPPLTPQLPGFVKPNLTEPPPLKVVKPIDFDDLLRKALDNVDYLMISAERLYREARAVKVKLELMKSVRSIGKG